MCTVSHKTWLLRRKTQHLICTVHIKPFYDFLFRLCIPPPFHFIRLSLIILVYFTCCFFNLFLFLFRHFLFFNAQPAKHQHSHIYIYIMHIVQWNLVCASFSVFSEVIVIEFVLSRVFFSLLLMCVCVFICCIVSHWNATKHIVPLLDLDVSLWYVYLFISAFFFHFGFF